MNTLIINEDIIKQMDIDNKLFKNKKYLEDTDWYYARKMETGKEVPADVVAKRIEAREYLNLGVTNE